ncbi:uncharacterized protein [Macrobrachium rosenbergii]|uniref:uncharacterized protein n=1 Tax=Macrobrachium rosenbergii TaxID=79674 RepID=UPI0034D3BB13
MPWSNEEVLVLIAEYEQRPILWNAFLDEYKDRSLKADTWAELAYVMQKDRHEVEKKVHALRVQFNEELRKLEKKRLAYGCDELPRSAWQYFDALSFIVAGCKKKKATHHPQVMAPLLPKPEGPQPLSFEEQAVALALTTTGATAPHDTFTSATPHSTSTSAVPHGTFLATAKGTNAQQGTQKKQQFDPRVKKHVLERVFDTANKPKIDEYNAFSAYIASEFRSLKSESVKKRLKKSILSALMRASEEDDAERNFGSQPSSQFFDSQNPVSSAPSPRGSSSPTTSIDDHHVMGMQSVTNQMVGMIDNVLRKGRATERPEGPSNVTSEPYLSPEARPIKEEMEEFLDDEKSREGAASPDFPGVHVTLNEGPLPQRKRRRTQYEDVQSSNRSPHNHYNDDLRDAESEEEELFGRYVAASLKKFPRRAKSFAKMRIQHALFETEEADRLGKEYTLSVSITEGN